MTGILFRHIFMELLKVLLVTTTVLVTVIAFGAAIKPLSENLLEAGDLLRYIVYATIPMMQYALPFSAAYAGTIVYHRMASDNEIAAMATSGVPYRRIILPAVAMGAILTVGMLVLVDSGVPAFWQAMKRIAWNDGIRLLAAQVRHGEAWAPSGLKIEIYADDAYVQRSDDAMEGLGADDPTRPTQRLVLDRVVALEKGVDGRPKTEFTARAATADQYRIGDSAYLKVVLSDATTFSRDDNRFARAAVVRPEAISVPSFEQGPKGLTFRELLTARDNLGVFPAVATAQAAVVAQLDAIALWNHIGGRLSSGTPLVLKGTGDASAMTLEVTGAELAGRDLVGTPSPDATKAAGKGTARRGKVTIRHFEERGGSRILRREVSAALVHLLPVPGDADGSPRVDLSIDDATVTEEQLGGRPIQRALRYSEVMLDGLQLERRESLDGGRLETEAARALAGPVAGPGEELRLGLEKQVDALAIKTRQLSNDIVARIVQRTAQSVTAFLMIVNAAILAVLLRGRSPLAVYAIGFLPAILDILLISGGEQMLRGSLSVLGFLVAYGGNAILAIACVVGAMKLRRH